MRKRPMTKREAQKHLNKIRRGTSLEKTALEAGKKTETMRRQLIKAFGKRAVRKAYKEGKLARDREYIRINRKIAKMIRDLVPFSVILKETGFTRKQIYARGDHLDPDKLIAKAMKRRREIKARARLKKAKDIWALRKKNKKWTEIAKIYKMTPSGACRIMMLEAENNPAQFKGSLKEAKEGANDPGKPAVRVVRMKWSLERKVKTGKEKLRRLKRARGWLDELEKGKSADRIAAREKISKRHLRRLMMEASPARDKKIMKGLAKAKRS